jgi:small GTP-binding protein
MRSQLQQVEPPRVRLYVWDTAGQERFRHITRNYYNSSNGIYVCFDLNEEKTFDSVENFWMRDLDKFAPENAVRFLVACKADREDEMEKRDALSARAKKFAAENNNMVYIECSAKTQVNIARLFDQMALTIYEEELSRMENDSLLKYRESSIC